MSETKRTQSGRECPPPPETPANQPHPPGVDECQDWPTPTPPELKDPDKCPEPPEHCNCPKGPTGEDNCLEKLIDAQVAQLAKADKAKAFKADLEALLGKAKTGSAEYTRSKYDKLVEGWLDQDAQIAELIRKLVCAVPCWRCVIECHICALLNELHYADQRLHGDGTLYTDVKNLYDLLYWHTRNREAAERRFKRIRDVLTAWENPAKSIEAVLNGNKTLIESVSKILGTNPGRAIYDVFFRLVPYHLAIAPPSNSTLTTRIDREYTDFCTCSTGTPDNCCGPDVGVRSVREQLVPPQAYLVDPTEYLTIICCLVEHRYDKAKQDLEQADADWIATDNRIKKNKAILENGFKNFEKDALALIPSVIDCCDYEEDDGDDDGNGGDSGYDTPKQQHKHTRS
jgi:hypothetical protein